MIKKHQAFKYSLATIGLLAFASAASAVPSWSMDMAYEDRAGNDRVFVANPDQDTVSVIDALNGNRLAEIAVGDDPRSIALDGLGFLWVTNKASSSISVINVNTLAVTNTIPGPLGGQPHGIVIDSDNNRAYVVLEASGDVFQLDTTNGALLASTNVGSNPREISINDAGTQVYLPRFITNPVAGESGINVANGGGEIIRLNTAGLTPAGTIAVPFNQAASGNDNNTSSRGVPNYLRSMAIAPNDASAFLPAKIDNIHRGAMRDGRARVFNILTRGILANINLTNNSENLGNRIEFANNSAPTAVAYGPNGNNIFVVHRGSRAFEVINANNGNIRFETTLEFAPTGVVASPDGNRVFVHNWLSRSLSIIDTSAIMNGGGNSATVINTVDLTNGEALSAQVLQGKRLFNDSADPRLAGQRYISCAQCHDDGGHDGRSYDFSDAGEGVRNTTDLRGRGDMEEGMVHWTANFDEMQDFENALREVFGGTGLMSNADFNATSSAANPNTMKTGLSAPLDAMAAYIDTLDDHGASPYRQANGALTAQAVAGRQVFETYSCATCHSGADFTDSPLGGSHNIGTVDAATGGRIGQPLINGGIDTPTLRGMWNDAPYLHDGAATTLAAAVQAHTLNMPVATNGLSNTELADLSAYLLQIDDSEPAPADPSVPPGTPDVFSTLAVINIDGNMGDWPADSMLVDDPQDATGGANQLDYQTLWMANDPQNLYIRYRNHQPNNVQATWGYEQAIDVDGPNTGFRPPNNTIPIGVDFMVEQNAIYRYTGNGANWSWAWVAPLTVELNGRDAELAIPRALLGDPDDFDFFFYADNNAIGGNAVDFVPNSTTNTGVQLDTRYFTYEFSGDSSPPVVDPPIDPPANNDPFVFHNQANALTMDGNLADWAALEFFPSDPNDVTGTGNQIDYLTAAAAHDANNIYIAWTNDGAAQVTPGNGIYIDTDIDFNTGFQGFANESPIGIDFLVETNSVYQYTGNGTSWVWQWVGNINPVAAANVLEMQIPANLLGNPTTFDLFFYGDSAAVGGNGIDFYPNAVTDSNSAITSRRLRYSTDATLAVSPDFEPMVNQILGQE